MNLEQTVKQMYDQGKKQLDEQNERRKKTDKELLAQITQSIDKAAETQRGQYQQNIDNAPQQFQKLYDANAVQEAVGRKAVEESMANMGLTDSGLNKSNQTVLAFQRGNADADARAKQMDYVTKMQNAIDTVLANAESKKATQAAGINKATSDWYTGALGGLASSAQKAGADAYAAEQKRLADVETANIKAQADIAKAEQKRFSDFMNGQKKDGVSDVQAMVNWYTQNPPAADAPQAEKDAYNAANGFEKTKQGFLQSGYPEEYANAAAESYLKTGDPMDGIGPMAEAEVDEAGIDTDNLTKFYSGENYDFWSVPLVTGKYIWDADFMTSEAEDVETAKGWTKGDYNEDSAVKSWKKSIQKSFDKASKSLKDSELSTPARQYALGKAIGKTIYPAVIREDSGEYKANYEVVAEALADLFDPDELLFKTAMETLGLSLEDVEE